MRVQFFLLGQLDRDHIIIKHCAKEECTLVRVGVLFFLCGLLLAACAAVSGASSASPATRVALYGELHGTQEMPEYFRSVVEQERRHHAPLYVGIEIPASDLKVACLAAHDRNFRRGGSSGWLAVRQDGRYSIAMAELICRLSSKRGVETFSLIGYAQSDLRDQMIAEAIIARARTGGYVVALVGNLHARNVAGSAADLVRNAGIAVTTYVFDARKSGEAWICTRAGTCGATEIGARFCATEQELSVEGVIAKDTPGTRWDKCISLERASASPPAGRRLSQTGEER